jgi:hypothetical protein
VEKDRASQKNWDCRIGCEKDVAVHFYASSLATDGTMMVTRTLVAFKRLCQGSWLTCLISLRSRHTYVGDICFGPVVQRTLDRRSLFVTFAILTVREVMPHNIQAP